MRFFVLFILAFGSKEKETVAEGGTACGEFDGINAEKPIVVKIEEDEYKENKRGFSEYIGVSFRRIVSKWFAQRQSKNEKKTVFNGSYDTEEEAAHASDTLARKLMENGEQGHRLNFPDDDTEVHGKRNSSQYIGVTYRKNKLKWQAQRLSKNENKMISNGWYDAEEAAAHASDTLARMFMENGEQGHKLNFPDDETHHEVHKRRESSKYIGVTYSKDRLKWHVQRWSKNEYKMISHGNHDTEEKAAHASDTLARKLIKNGEQSHKLNFPDDETEREKKRKRSEDLGNLQDI